MGQKSCYRISTILQTGIFFDVLRECTHLLQVPQQAWVAARLRLIKVHHHRTRRKKVPRLPAEGGSARPFVSAANPMLGARWCWRRPVNVAMSSCIRVASVGCAADLGPRSLR